MDLHTRLNKRGQIVVPVPIRKRYGLRAGDHLLWLDDGQTIQVIPVPVDAIRSLRRRGRGEGLVEKLLKERREGR